MRSDDTNTVRMNKELKRENARNTKFVIIILVKIWNS